MGDWSPCLCTDYFAKIISGPTLDSPTPAPLHPPTLPGIPAMPAAQFTFQLPLLHCRLWGVSSNIAPVHASKPLSPSLNVPYCTFCNTSAGGTLPPPALRGSGLSLEYGSALSIMEISYLISYFYHAVLLPGYNGDFSRMAVRIIHTLLFLKCWFVLLSLFLFPLH